MAKFAQGKFVPKHPEKYVGNKTPTYRSSWELAFMQFLDSNSNIISWASEAIKIPYRHPFTNKQTIYVPDFFVLYQNRFGNQVAEIVEIKPKKQSIIESKVSSAKNQAIVAVNRYKWKAAAEYCKRNGLIFRVITEDQLFWNNKNK